MYDYSYYDYGYGYEEVATGLAVAGVGLVIYWLICVGISVFTLVCMWKVFKKAGKPGWAALVPIYNIIVMLEIAELPMWYIALFFVPFANIYAMFKIYIEVAHKFGKSTGFGVGMVFLAPIFLGILAFGKDSNYVGTQNVGQTVQQSVQPQPMYQQPIQPMEPQVQSVEQPVPPVVPVQQSEPQVQQSTISNPVSPKFCTNCGNQVDANAKFCTRCGNQL